MTKRDPVLGPVRKCRVCRDLWPEDLEFFGPLTMLRTLRRTCRACRAERRHGVTAPTRVRTPEAIARRKAQDAARYQRRRERDLEAVRAGNRAAAGRYYAAHAEVIRERRRVRYADEAGGSVRVGFGRPRIAA